MITALLICFAYNILNGEWDAWKIKRHKKVNHPMNAGFYIAIVIAICFVGDWKMCFSCLAQRPLVFDTYLNIRRFGLKGAAYQPQSPDSVVDRMENKLFGKYAWALSNLSYLIIFIGGWVLYEKT